MSNKNIFVCYKKIRGYNSRTRESTTTKAIMIVSVFAVCVFSYFWRNEIKELIPLEKIKYTPLIMFFFVFPSYYLNFKTSIRSFKHGLILPGFIHKEISWSKIESINKYDKHFELITTNGVCHWFIIHKRDHEDLQNIITQFNDAKE